MKSLSKRQGSLFGEREMGPGLPGIEFVQGRTLGMTGLARLAFARSFAFELIRRYWRAVQGSQEVAIPFKAFRNTALLKELLAGEAKKAQELGEEIAALSALDAGYRIGCIYTAALPERFRSQLGVFYTPPALCQRLIELVSDAGIDWRTARILDPACGGAAFLAPLALRMAQSLIDRDAPQIVGNISSRLTGFEIDPFAAWMSQTLVEVALADLCRESRLRLNEIVTVQDSLSENYDGQGRFDVIIGNPPYGRVKLSPSMRRRFQRSLHGHANLYGLFTDRAVSWAKPGGVIAFVTPTGMLGGQYFKNLRRLLGVQAPPISVDFVTARSGVFEGVLQETMLAVYRADAGRPEATVSFIELADNGAAKVTPAGTLTLPHDSSQPWLIPRHQGQRRLADRLRQLTGRISDYGYHVSTGPLVWNRHKGQFESTKTKGTYPVVWAEAVTSGGVFKWQAEKRNHLPWFRPSEKDRWVLTNRPCILVQRTTAKEQHRRLIAAELPKKFVERYGRVAVENHLNMVWTDRADTPVSTKFMAALLNSKTVDSAFRCINGSVAVSAYELEALPLPEIDDARELESMFARGMGEEEFEEAVGAIYMGTKHATASVA